MISLALGHSPEFSCSVFEAMVRDGEIVSEKSSLIRSPRSHPQSPVLLSPPFHSVPKAETFQRYRSLSSLSISDLANADFNPNTFDNSLTPNNERYYKKRSVSHAASGSLETERLFAENTKYYVSLPKGVNKDPLYPSPIKVDATSLFDVPPKYLARQITLFYMKLYRKVTFDDLCQEQWDTPKNPLIQIGKETSAFASVVNDYLKKNPSSNEWTSIVKLFNQCKRLGNIGACYEISAGAALATTSTTPNTSATKKMLSFNEKKKYNHAIDNEMPPCIISPMTANMTIVQARGDGGFFLDKERTIVDFAKMRVLKNYLLIIHFTKQNWYCFSEDPKVQKMITDSINSETTS
jgi:hypothetical protein